MVGEIRDRETAQIAIEAALTGHLVLSTLHTNDAPSAITRLIEMGIEPFLVASAIDCVVAQRLVRMLCPHCKRRVILPAAALRENGYSAQLRRRGLRAGRLQALRRQRLPRPHRHLRGDDDQRRDPRARARAHARPRRSARWRSARACAACATTACDKVKQGRTSIAEVARVIGNATAAPMRRGELEHRPGASRCLGCRHGPMGDAMAIDFADLLMEVVKRRASDLHLTAGAPPDRPRARPPVAARANTRS